ncbi:MAG: 4-alpha-glucanotransferase [Christensenellaceae bacterium]|jgi:4-alpha-glucanotransferase|nr:4-alpha-glucanotransferase [Christensenellaceae bacterium]
MERSSGILMHISSLPNRFGIGSMGKEAYEFVDFLARAKQRYWQMLPLGPTGYGDSPYQLFSACAGNPYLIDIDLLLAQGLLTEDEAAPSCTPESDAVDYGRLYAQRFALLRLAFARGYKRDGAAFADFAQANKAWLNDYALFMALKAHFGMVSFTLWPDAIRLREAAALAEYAELLKEDIRYYAYLQFLFFRQWSDLKAYANKQGVRLIGDLPIYVSMDSADVWAQPQVFQLNEARRPEWVSGVPPDYFTADGQLWGNPLYDWEALKSTGYAWWCMRIRMNMRQFDMLRIDHFRGLDSYWRVKAQETTARNGEWVDGPGMDFIRTIQAEFPGLPIIAEDLGYLTPSVRELVRASGFPGMKVLQFAFDPLEPSDYLPHNYMPNCVCYTGTHDNTTARGWFSEAACAEVHMATRYLGLNCQEGYAWGMIRGGISSAAALFVAQMQDYLDLPSAARMNTPGTTGGNWRWRMRPGAATPQLAEKLAYFTAMYSRG